MAECATVCEHLHLPVQSGSDRTLARMHRGYTAERYLETPGDGARRDPRPRGHHRHHRRLPRRDRRRLRAHARGGRRRARTTPRTRSCSRRARAPPRPRWSTTSSPRGRAGAHGPAHRGGRAPRAGEARGARRAHRGASLVEGPSKKDPTRVVGPHPPEQARALRARRARARPSAAPSTSRSPAPRRTGCAATSSRCDRRPAPGAHPHPGHGAG